METLHLNIRDTVFEDCKIFADWEKDPAVTEFFTMNEDRNYEEVVTEFIESRKDESTHFFTITLKPELTPIGRVSFTRIDRHYDSLDITRIYIADPALRNRGYGEEALRALLQYAFLNLHMERVTLDHFIKNKGAAHLYAKVGFVDEGVMRNAGKKNGKYYDLALMSMTRSEYLNGNKGID